MLSKDNPIPMEELIKIAASPAGQKLLRSLQQSNGSQMQQAAELAAQGDLNGARRVLEDLIQNPQVKQLLDQIGR